MMRRRILVGRRGRRQMRVALLQQVPRFASETTAYTYVLAWPGLVWPGAWRLMCSSDAWVKHGMKGCVCVRVCEGV